MARKNTLFNSEIRSTKIPTPKVKPSLGNGEGHGTVYAAQQLCCAVPTVSKLCIYLFIIYLFIYLFLAMPHAGS